MDVEEKVSDLEADILKEILNIGLAKVADSFAIMAKEPVMLNIPQIDIVHFEELETVLPANEVNDALIETEINGDLKAKSLLIFSRTQIDKIANICIGPEKDFRGNYNAMKKSLLLEISNILTGALVTQFANIFDMSIVGLPPVAIPYRIRKICADLLGNLILHKPIILTVKTKFLNTGKEVALPMILLFDIGSMLKILAVIRERNLLDANWLAHHQ